jgi:hypothetical protein
MSNPEIVVRAALTIGGPSVYHEIRGNVRKIAAKLAEQGMVSRMGTPFTPSAILNMVHA